MLTTEQVRVRMRVYIYESQKEAGFFGVTPQQNGGNLPTESGPWKLIMPTEITGRARIGLDEQQAEFHIARDGYHLTRAGVITKDPNEQA